MKMDLSVSWIGMILFLVNFSKIGIPSMPTSRRSNVFEFLDELIFRPTFVLNFMGLEMLPKKPLPLSFTYV